MRFYDVDSGAVYVDGREIHTLTRDSLRRGYAMVLQDTWVFRGTIYENIAYGKEGATREEVEAAAKAAHIHNYIMRLPQGYNTVISEDGGNISKGQKQLLTIARAMLYGTSMLILDEATSNVDTNTERQVQTAMRTLMQGAPALSSPNACRPSRMPTISLCSITAMWSSRASTSSSWPKRASITSFTPASLNSFPHKIFDFAGTP